MRRHWDWVERCGNHKFARKRRAYCIIASRTCYNARALNKIAAAAIQFIVLAKDYEKREFTAHCFVVKNLKITKSEEYQGMMQS